MHGTKQPSDSLPDGLLLGLRTIAHRRQLSIKDGLQGAVRRRQWKRCRQRGHALS
jgi:hypothetical protein